MPHTTNTFDIGPIPKIGFSCHLPDLIRPQVDYTGNQFRKDMRVKQMAHHEDIDANVHDSTRSAGLWRSFLGLFKAKAGAGDSERRLSQPLHPLLKSTAPMRMAATLPGASLSLISDALGDEPAMVVSAAIRTLNQHILHLETQAVDVVIETDLEKAVRRLSRRPRAFSLAVIDIDSFGGIVDVYDRLRDLRDRMPSLPVILVTRETSTNDFGTHRLAITDVTLRKPLSVTMLEIGILEAAITNNLIWQSRKHALDVSATGRGAGAETLPLHLAAE